MERPPCTCRNVPPMAGINGCSATDRPATAGACTRTLARTFPAHQRRTSDPSAMSIRALEVVRCGAARTTRSWSFWGIWRTFWSSRLRATRSRRKEFWGVVSGGDVELIFFCFSANNTKWGTEDEKIATLSFVLLDKNKNKVWERKEWKTFRELVTAAR